MKGSFLDVEKYSRLARRMAAEGIVMLENRDNALPLAEGSRISVFGRSQLNYYRSGTGSGGLVNVPYTVGILDALLKEPGLVVNQELLRVYRDWEKSHPFDMGQGWASEPWSQEEMEVSEALVEDAAKASDAAVILIGRTAGEDQDASDAAGSYRLSAAEYDMLRKVCRVFSRTVVLLNVGGIMDMSWVGECSPCAVLYVWQGGQEGGNAVADVLTGRVSPCGKLPDTIAAKLGDYPSSPNFGDAARNVYEEDIYVGYRYFETFAPEKVLYPFGYGISYTTFSLLDAECTEEDGEFHFSVKVKNTGSFQGKEVVQLYVRQPQGRLGKPRLVLCGFEKTSVLDCGEEQEIAFGCTREDFASYDDSGVTGHPYAKVLEVGDYEFYMGTSVRDVEKVFVWHVEETQIIESLHQAMAPKEGARRLHPTPELKMDYEPMPVAAPVREEVREEGAAGAVTGAAAGALSGVGGSWKLEDVYFGRTSMEDFVRQLSDHDLCCLQRGEGMCSPKATPGTASAFGGVTDRLWSLGIPVACCSDGPSGIRMDCGAQAFSLPNGTCMAASFNVRLVELLFEMEGREMRRNQVDILLGPGLNIHRNPLNGRNFEYFSEDPLLTGKMAAAQLRGLHSEGVTGCIKHLACNNQEYMRTETEAVVSERALREIYLRAFEIAVKEGEAIAIMTSYNPINGFWSASNEDLLTTILRKEWGFDGIVMTDWWAKGNDEGEAGSRQNVAAIARSQNDLYMVVQDADTNSGGDNLETALEKTPGLRLCYRRNAANILRTIMKLPCFARRLLGQGNELPDEEDPFERFCRQEALQIALGEECSIPAERIETRRGGRNLIDIEVEAQGEYEFSFTCRSLDSNPLSQMPVSVFQNRRLLQTMVFTGADSEWTTRTLELCANKGKFRMVIFFGQGGLEIKEIRLRKKR